VFAKATASVREFRVPLDVRETLRDAPEQSFGVRPGCRYRWSECRPDVAACRSDADDGGKCKKPDAGGDCRGVMQYLCIGGIAGEFAGLKQLSKFYPGAARRNPGN
jgi:hypothetical protein